MEQSIQQKNSAGYRADLVECIEKALIGQLSPSDQEYCFEEIKSLRGTGKYPPDGDHLLCQLHGILSFTPQISEHEPFPKKWTRKMRKKQNEANRSE